MRGDLPMFHLRLPARLESLNEFLNFVSDRSAESGFSSSRTKEIQLAVEEAVVNIVRHAYADSLGEIELRWMKGADPGQVAIEIEDAGVPFDVRSASAPNLQAGLDDRKVGGLGVFFIRQIADEVGHRREGDKNILTLTLGARKPSSGPGPSEAPRADDDLGFPLGSMTRETHKKGDILFKAGDRADKMFYVARGSLKLPEIGKVVKEGEVVGEMGILSPFHVRTASAVCEEDLEAYTVDKEDVIRLFSRDSALAFQLVNLCIKRFIENLRAETEAKERIQSELRIAREIQISMLPRVFPPFPDRTEFDIFAVMEPAKEVGGDFYDFFFVDDKRLCVVIGDVSGKGVPAALFMAICKTLLKTEALRGLSPGDILDRVNRTLIPDNETMMFVTVFLLILNVETGEIRYSNGGHPPPLISAGPGRFEILDGPTGTVLGAVEGCPYTTTTRILTPGDIVFLFTDGMSEAMNADQELFSDARLISRLCEETGKCTADLIRHMRAAVQAFADGTPPSDDMTMVALAFKGAARNVSAGP
jgi:serine phosphatase RsbU (regulator of sigma subunit)/anti-sigma regulatory factor (Ser/Thr protein kinase)